MIHPEAWPRVDAPDLRRADVERRVEGLLASMTLEEKVGQLIQADIASIEPEDLLTYRLGAILNGANSAPGGDNYAHPSVYLALADAFYDASVNPAGGEAAIPVIWGTDAVHGHSNIVGATVFPHNIGLGAARDPELIRAIGAATALEVRATGMDWTFAPTVAVARDDRWGRTYESYSEDPELVARYAGHMVEGLQGAPGSDDFLGDDRVIATVKHYVGDGGTVDGVDQGDNWSSESELRDVHGAGYPPAIEAGVQTVMASFNSWHGEKLHGHRGLLTDVLVGRMGFDGLVVGDWNGHGQVEGCSNESCPSAFRAGLDMAMAPDSWKALYHNTLTQVRNGEISSDRLDQAVTRVLRVKVRCGVFERGRPSSRPHAGHYALLGAPAHRALARLAVRESLVLLKNNGNVLPLDPRGRILVAGDAADDIGFQSGGWTLTWQGEGNTNDDFPNGQSIFAGISEAAAAAGGEAVLAPGGVSGSPKPDAAIVVFGEEPYAEFQGDRKHLDYHGEHALEILRRLQAEDIPVVSVFLSGRPLYVTPELNASDAFVAAWLPGSEGGGIADVLLRDQEGNTGRDFRGKLSFSWPERPDQTPLNHGDPDYHPLFPYGYGLTYADSRDLPTLEEAAGADCPAEAGELMRAGRTRRPYRMVLVSEGGETVVEGPAAATRDGRLQVRSVDRQAQEDARQITWRGPGRFSIRGGPEDLSREASARMVLTFTYALPQAPSGRVRAGVDCAGGCALHDITAELCDRAGGGWHRMELPLAEPDAVPETLSAVAAPFVLESEGLLELRLADVRLAMPERQSDGGD